VITNVAHTCFSKYALTPRKRVRHMKQVRSEELQQSLTNTTLQHYTLVRTSGSKIHDLILLSDSEDPYNGTPDLCVGKLTHKNRKAINNG
jgi:hypothetical protein